MTELGHPYVWVQKLGGLHFPKDQPQAGHSPFPLHRNTELGLGEALGDGCVLSQPPELPLAPAAPNHGAPWTG